MASELLDAWRVNNRVNLMLLDSIPTAALSDTLSTRGGRDVAGQFAHLHAIRITWLESFKKDFAKGLAKLDAKGSPTKAALEKALTASGEAVERFIEQAEAGGKRGFKRGLGVTVACFIAHDSHHRGSILLTLKQCGHAVDRETQFGIWEWDKI